MLNMKSKIFKYIYAMLCLLPAIAVGITCAYVVNNQNANINDNTSEYADYTPIDSFSDFELGQVYNINNSNANLPNSTSTVNFGVYCEIVNVYYTNLNYINNSIKYFRLYRIPNFAFDSVVLYTYDENNTEIGSGTIPADSYFSFDFVYLNSSTSSNFTYFTSLFYYQPTFVSSDSQLANVFYYSLDKVENSSVFSWVKSNFLYEGVNNFVGIFGGTNSNISFYLTWVLTISLCYLGFEVLMLFINMARNLIHSFTDKDRW